MLKSYFLRGGLALVILSVAGFAGWLSTLPPAAAIQEAPAVPQQEADALLASLKPRNERPLVAVIGLNDATETTDYLMPTGILRRAGVVDVTMLATRPGPVKLYPALTVEPDATIAAFDAAHPQGADYVIVPAMSRDDDPAVIAWLKSQAEKGATVIGICAGAKVVAAAGLLDGKRATTHWYYLGELLKGNPTIRYVADRRMVADEGVATTTGISASMPMMLTLIEAIAGRDKAEAVAHELGIDRWDMRHASGAFRLTRRFATTVLANRLAFWKRDAFVIGLEPGMDEVSLALAADGWSRTYRSSVATHSASAAPVESRNGVRIVPDHAGPAPAAGRALASPGGRPADALDRTLGAIATRYGERTAGIVAMQLEYPRR
jgi:transcriptional regulator GlxA family with amidase domain